MSLLSDFELWCFRAQAKLEAAGAEVELERRREKDFTAVLLFAANEALSAQIALTVPPPDSQDPQAEILIVDADTDDLLYMRTFAKPPDLEIMKSDLDWTVQKLIAGDLDGFPEERCVFWPPDNSTTEH